MNKGMKKHVMRAAACFVTGSMLAGSSSMAAFAAGTNLVGVSTTVNVKEAAAEDTQKTEETESTTEGTASEENTESAEAAQDSSLIGTVAVAQPGDETFFNIRANADANSDVVGYLYENNCATILGEEGDWYYIQSGNCTGYVAKYLMTTGADAAAVVEQAATPVAQVNAEALMVRSEPSEDADVVDTVTADQIVYLEEDLGGWAKISTGSTEGYVSADYVSYASYLPQGETHEEAEARIAGMLEDIDFLKVAHHGSRYSTGEAFLKKTKPEIAVISCSSTNRYGHPGAETVKRLQQENCRIWYTMKSGAITVRVKAKTFRVEPFLSEN